jgi:serine phosphatase RsbU (regulator of sigma subunit)
MRKLITVIFLLLFFSFFINNAQAQSSDIEKFELSIKDIAEDSALVKRYLGFVLSQKSDSTIAFEYLHKGIEIAKNIKYKEGQANGIRILASLQSKFKYSSEDLIRSIKKAIKLYAELGQTHDEVNMINALIRIYTKENRQEELIGFYEKSLTERSDDLLYTFHVNSQMGRNLKENGQHDLALKYFRVAIDLFPEISDRNRNDSLAQFINYRHLGVCFRYLDLPDSSYLYFDEGKNIALRLKDSVSIGSVYNSMALTYTRFEDYENAIHYYHLSLAYKKTGSNKNRLATVYINLSSIYTELNQFTKAEEYLEKAINLCDEDCSDRRSSHLFRVASEFYGKTKRYDLAYHYLNDYLALIDSMEVRESSNLAQELEAKFANEKNSILQEKLNAELEATNLRDKQQKDKLNRQQILLVVFSLIAIIMIVLVVFVYRSNIKRKKANEELLNKNEKINLQSEKIHFQNEELGQKNREIVDSINYAKRIQNAILPTEKVFQEKLGESFVLYAPKDIVAGDFYWMETPKKLVPDNASDIVLFAAADCTGHGVPGAMVSVICNNGLNRSVREHKLLDPGKILDKTREIVLEEFEKSEEEVKDGMDIALVSLQKGKEHTKIDYAGAHNPLWIIRKDSKEIEEYKANKQPIGKYDELDPYTTHSIELNKGDSLYVFSDGYSDQFGGEKGKAGGKKMKTTNFKKLLLSIQELSMAEQKDKLLYFFNEWKGDLEQLDDVCVIGVRV